MPAKVTRSRWATHHYPDPGSLPGPAGGAEAYNVVLRPGDTSKAANVFSSSADLFAAAVDGKWQGQVLVTVDDSIESPVHLTAQTVAMSPALNWTFVGVASFNDVRSTAAMTIDDGFHINATGSVQLTFIDVDASSPATTDVCTVGANIEFNLVLDGSRLAMQGAGAFLNSSSGLGFSEVFIHDFSELGDGVHPAIKGAPGAATIDALTGSHVRVASLSGGGVISNDASSEQDIAPAVGFTLILEDQAVRVGYPPGTPANWPGVNKPTQVQGAIDEIAADLATHVFNVSPGIAAGNVVEEDSVPYTSTTGVVHISAGMQVNAGTGVAGDSIFFQLTQDGAVIAGAPAFVDELSATLHVASANLEFEISGVAPGPHTYGIRATDQSGGRTIQVFNEAAYVRVEDLF